MVVVVSCSSYLSTLERQFDLHVAGLLPNPQVHLVFYYYYYYYCYKQWL